MKEFTTKINTISELMKSFSNKDKLSILCFLGDSTKNVSEIITCSNISQSQISQYLGKMKLEGILDSEKVGKEVFYRISDEKVLEVISSLKEIFGEEKSC
ncbi:MAG: metalloregulator ArsR/SmtB family transcription factor [Candidatus Gracilibacteria bacterium]|nr:metalloregulator ArsR/SmtB family transcription factor [Candidatus Gracilibacteria bacterium]